VTLKRCDHEKEWTWRRPFLGVRTLDRREAESLLKFRPSASIFRTEVLRRDFASEVMVLKGESGAQIEGSSTKYSVL
jgi:hypothetical protein